MKQIRQNNQKTAQNRLVYQQKPSNEGSNEKMTQKVDNDMAQYSESIKNSYGDRLGIKLLLDKQIEPIKEENSLWENTLRNLRNELKTNPSQKTAKGEFECFGKKLTIVVTANGEDLPPFETYLGDKPLEEGFIAWAIKMKKEQKEKPNA